MFTPANTGFCIAVAPLLATAILLLATARAWIARRTFVEGVTLSALILLARLGLEPLPVIVRHALVPLATAASAWLALAQAEWRFAPDCGQRGWAWIFYATARPAFAAALGTAAFLLLASLAGPGGDNFFLQIAGLVATAIAARIIDQHLTRRPGGFSSAPASDEDGGQPVTPSHLIPT